MKGSRTRLRKVLPESSSISRRGSANASTSACSRCKSLCANAINSFLVGLLAIASHIWNFEFCSCAVISLPRAVPTRQPQADRSMATWRSISSTGKPGALTNTSAIGTTIWGSSSQGLRVALQFPDADQQTQARLLARAASPCARMLSTPSLSVYLP
jgi:hypothetical protein